MIHNAGRRGEEGTVKADHPASGSTSGRLRIQMTDTTFCTSSSSTVQVTLRMVSGRVMKLLVEAGQQRRQVIHFAGAVEQQLVPKGGGHEPRTHVCQPGRCARRRRGRSESPAEARGHNVGGQVQDLGVPDEESDAHLAALIGGTDLVDQPAGRDGQGTPTHTGADIYGAGTLVEAKPVRVDEAD